MGMTIDESIEVLKEHLRILNVDKGIEFWKEIEALEMALDTMRKYQQIQELLDDGWNRTNAAEMLLSIEEVIENGKID